MKWKLQALLVAGLLSATSVRASADNASATTILVTGYSCPPYCGLTASGNVVGPGSAACPSYWRGQTITIDFPDGPKTVTCDDAYATYLSSRIDVFWSTLDDCYSHTGWFPVER